MQFDELIHLEPHGADTFVGTGPRYPWGGLYGGQIVAQALRAAAATVEPAFVPHSLRAYFIRAGDHTEPVRYEVDRIRNGRSFCTRRVVARQAIGAILNLEASFHVAEETEQLQTGGDARRPRSGRLRGRLVVHRVRAPDRHPASPSPGGQLVPHAGGHRQRRSAGPRRRAGLHLRRPAHRRGGPGGRPADFEDGQGWFSVSLDHAIWFHRPIRIDDWHLQTFTCHGFANGRGLAIGHVFTPDGTHAATIAQEVLVRKRRN